MKYLLRLKIKFVFLCAFLVTITTSLCSQIGKVNDILNYIDPEFSKLELDSTQLVQAFNFYNKYKESFCDKGELKGIVNSYLQGILKDDQNSRYEELYQGRLIKTFSTSDHNGIKLNDEQVRLLYLFDFDLRRKLIGINTIKYFYKLDSFMLSIYTEEQHEKYDKYKNEGEQFDINDRIRLNSKIDRHNVDYMEDKLQVYKRYHSRANIPKLRRKILSRLNKEEIGKVNFLDSIYQERVSSLINFNLDFPDSTKINRDYIDYINKHFERYEYVGGLCVFWCPKFSFFSLEKSYHFQIYVVEELQKIRNNHKSFFDKIESNLVELKEDLSKEYLNIEYLNKKCTGDHWIRISGGECVDEINFIAEILFSKQ